MLVIIIAAYTLSYYIVNIVQPAIFIKRMFKLHPGARIKPIDCTPCLSVWIAVSLFFLPKEYSEFIAIAFSAGYLSIKFT